MSQTANYAATPKVGVGQLSVANAALDGTGTIVTVFTAGASGSRLDSVTIKATTSVVNGVVRLFVNDGTTSYLLTEVPVQSTTASTTNTTFEDGRQLNIVLQTGWSLRAATSVAQTINIIAIGGDF